MAGGAARGVAAQHDLVALGGHAEQREVVPELLGEHVRRVRGPVAAVAEQRRDGRVRVVERRRPVPARDRTEHGVVAVRAVADRPEAGQPRHGAVRVHGDAAARVAGHDAVEPVGGGAGAHGGEHDVGRQLAAVGEPDAVGPDLRDDGTGDELGTRGRVPGREVRPDVRAELAVQRRTRGLDDGDVRTGARRDAGELRADPPGPDEDEAQARPERGAQGVGVGRGVEHARVLPAARPHGHGADREHDGVGGEAVARPRLDGPAGSVGGPDPLEAHGRVGEADVVGERVDVHPEVVGEPRGGGPAEELLRQGRAVVRRHALRAEQRDAPGVAAAAERGEGLGAREPGADDDHGRRRPAVVPGGRRAGRRAGRGIGRGGGGSGRDRRHDGRHARHARARR